MAREWNDVRAELGLDENAVAREKALIQTVTRLYEIRKSRGVSQHTLAGELGVSQPSISQLESRDESLQLETMARYIAGLGGTVKVLAVFDDEMFIVDPDGHDDDQVRPVTEAAA